MFCMRLHQISLHFVVYNILTRYISNHSFLARFFGLCSIFCWQGVVSFIVSSGREN